eukprot:CAMPEP_0202862386 /NCGR_PEP_ID=MMETSP1391-20130828/3452_1 /ASSEMBLY_ACC=CAM_ASM_000867 /TAXON_ID=1034604 /ORGANISM="Chlamydomonas leiostraca, Strain SAG 11-49" /LENGTH=301 /DNA_ID=CAMNT_0049541921 /DNA_START=148 /DNA_END=1050 /DNA_ORIENTATION=-
MPEATVMRAEASSESGDIHESTPLLPPPAEDSRTQQLHSSPGGLLGTASGSQHKSGDAGTGICRICLEEDSCGNLDEPCGCSGTQRHAHHACIQRWVDEKGHTRCEICDHEYQGHYQVPAVPLSARPAAVDHLPLFAPMYILDPADARARGNVVVVQGGDDEGGANAQHSGISWCLTFILMFMFLVVLHHTLLVADSMDPDAAPGGGHDDPAPYSPSGGATGTPDEYAASLTFFLFWVATKAFLVGVPLYTVMRVAARQARREQYEAMMREDRQYTYRFRSRRDRSRSRQQRQQQQGEQGQ